MAAIFQIPMMPAAPAKLREKALSLPAAPVNLVAPTAEEAAAIRQYVFTLMHIRTLCPIAVSVAELSNWMAYASGVENAASGMTAAIANAIAAVVASLNQVAANPQNLREQFCNIKAIEDVNKLKSAAEN